MVPSQDRFTATTTYACQVYLVKKCFNRIERLDRNNVFLPLILSFMPNATIDSATGFVIGKRQAWKQILYFSLYTLRDAHYAVYGQRCRTTRDVKQNVFNNM